MIKITRETADEFIKAILPMAKNCIINIMNTEGIIVSSSDITRIGTFHTGAKKAIDEKKIIRIYKNNINLFPGCREGINIPIINDNEILGAVGIYGEPDTMENAASLLTACIRLYLKLLISEEKLRLDKNARFSLLTEILKGDDLSSEAILKQLNSIEFSFLFPIRIIILKIKNLRNSKISLLKKYDKIEKLLLNLELLNYKEDLSGVYLDDVIILKKDKGIREIDNYLGNVKENLKKILNYDCKLFVSERCYNLEDIPFFYSELKKMSLLDYDICNMDKYKYKFIHLFNRIPEREKNRLIGPLYKKLFDYFQEKNINEIIYTIKIYSDNDFNVTKTSEKLNIHKNTLIYRLNKIFSLTELDKENIFFKFFFIQAILLYKYNKNYDGR